MSRRIVLTMLIILVFNGLIAAALTDKEVLLEYYNKRAFSSLEYTYTVKMDNELVSVALVKAKDIRTYMEAKSEGMISYAINDGQFMYMWTSVSNMGQKYDLKQYENKGEAGLQDIQKATTEVRILGRESVNGYDCVKAEIKMDGEVQYQWISEKYGIAIRVLKDNMQMDVTNVIVRDIPDSTFIPPAGIDFSGSMFPGLVQMVQQAVQQAAEEAAKAMEENRPLTEEEFISLIAKRGTIPAVYTEQYDNMLKTKVSVSVKGKKEYRAVDAAVKLYMLYDGADIYTWNSVVKTVSKVKPNDLALKVLAPYDPSIMYATDFSLYAYKGREEIRGEQCRGANVIYNGKSYEIWVSERLGVLMKMSVDDVYMTVTMVNEQDIPDDRFALPSGYKVK
ncbi:MAG: hypothetical protein KBB09_03510 [Firmicutes bacterium]|nr:hypothetical protein [Bacillota bacterium]